MSILSKWLESLDYEYEILSSCTRHLSPRSTCNVCIDVCEKKAITMLKGKPVIQNKTCVECGRCISACPVQSIAGIYPKRRVVQNKLVVEDHSIPTVKELLIFYKKGIRVIIAETHTLLEGWKQEIGEANAVLIELNEAPFFTLIQSIDEDETISRRELFALWKKESKSVVEQAVPAKWRFNQSDFHLPNYYINYQFARITIDSEKCTLCSVCLKLCKRKCFSIREEHFILSSQGCSDCQLCVDTCPEKAIIVESKVSIAEEILLPIYNKVCQVCKKTYETLREHDDKCMACKKRERFLL